MLQPWAEISERLRRYSDRLFAARHVKRHVISDNTGGLALINEFVKTNSAPDT